MKVCVGGTFDILHSGHINLLKKAFDVGDEVVIGLSSDEFLRKMGKEGKSYEERLSQIESFLRKEGKKARIEPLNSIYGSTLHEDFDAIVVSPESEERAKIINELRKKNGMRELKIIKIPYTLAEDGIPISSSRIKRGEIDGWRRLKKMRIAVPTSNNTKMEAVKNVFSSLFSFPMEFKMIDIEIEKRQPYNEEILKYAMERCKKCRNYDYCIGIESGIRREGKINFVEQYVAAIDSSGYITYGKSPSFEIPWWIAEKLKGKELKELIPPEYREKGAVWYLSGKIDRLELTEIGVLMAMIPRLHGIKTQRYEKNF